VAKALANAGITFDREVTVQFCGQANRSCAIVGFAIYRDWGTVLLEVDEHQHDHYAVTCEARMLNVFVEQMKQGRAESFPSTLLCGEGSSSAWPWLGQQYDPKEQV